MSELCHESHIFQVNKVPDCYKINEIYKKYVIIKTTLSTVGEGNKRPFLHQCSCNYGQICLDFHLFLFLFYHVGVDDLC